MSTRPKKHGAARHATGRFVLLPKNLVTGVAKARIMILRPAGSDLIVATQAPAQSGLFCRRPKKSAPPKRGKKSVLLTGGDQSPGPPQTSKSATVPSDSRFIAAALSFRRVPRVSPNQADPTVADQRRRHAAHRCGCPHLHAGAI